MRTTINVEALSLAQRERLDLRIAEIEANDAARATYTVGAPRACVTFELRDNICWHAEMSVQGFTVLLQELAVIEQGALATVVLTPDALPDYYRS